MHQLEPMRYEEHPDRYQRITVSSETSPLRFRAEDIRQRLDQTAAPSHGRHGPRITLDSPTTPSMGLTVERLAAGAVTAPHRSTASRVFVVLDGEGITDAGDGQLPWRRGDTVVVPCWSTFTHRATADATLFAVSDEPTMRALGHYFED